MLLIFHFSRIFIFVFVCGVTVSYIFYISHVEVSMSVSESVFHMSIKKSVRESTRLYEKQACIVFHTFKVRLIKCMTRF